jgi:IclR family transcriptional regulator, acetate operon repressor
VEAESLTPAQVFSTPPRYPIDSVDNALRLLSLFRENKALRVKDAAEALGVATGTAHRLLTMLVYRGYVTQDPITRLYRPGVMLLSIGLEAARRSDRRATARPYLEELNAQLDETVQLARLEGSQVLFLDAVESSRTLRVTARTGTLHPAHCTSVGKVLLAELPRDRVVELYPEEALPRPTSNSIATRSELLLELETIRDRGFATNFGELEEGVGSVAAIVRDTSRHANLAIGAGAPLSRLDDVRIQQFAAMLREAAERLGAELSA